MFVLFLIALVSADKCTYDSTRTSDDYLLLDNYHERYCSHSCPCDSLENCEMDFTYSGFRELQNASGEIDVFTTREYNYTFAINVPADKTYKIGKTQIKSARMHYKLGENSVLTVGTQEVVEGYEKATLNTIVRCNKKCTVKDSKFPKGIKEQISFMAEKDGEAFIDSEITLENVEFYVQSESEHFEKNYAREQLKVNMKNVNFVIDEDVTNKEVIGLFFSTIPLEGFDVKITLNNNPNNNQYEIKQQCDNKWLVAVKQGSTAQIKCDDPTISYGDADLEDDCEIAFIVIIVLADVALFTLIAVFLVLILVPIIKNKKAKKYQEI